MNQEKDMDTDRKLSCGPEKDIGYYIKRINDKLKAGFDAYLCDVDLTSSQARVIEYVYWNGGMVTQKEIEVFLDVAHPTVVGIVNRLVFIVVMIVMGLNQGMQPIAGYNFGAKLYGRVNKVLRLTIIYATAVTTFGFLVGMLVPDLVVGIFTSDAELTELSVTGLRITVMFFPIIGFQMVTSNFFQSIGMAGKAIFLSLTRQMLILLPCLLVLPQFFGVAGVWYSMPVSDLLASLIALVMLVCQFRKFRTSPL